MFVSGSNMTGRALHKTPDSKRVGEGPPLKARADAQRRHKIQATF